MTRPGVAPAELLKKGGAEADLLRVMIHNIVGRVIQFDVEDLGVAG
jgi:hypothetical protein